MTYKTILLNLENESQVPHLIKAAVCLAGQYESHVIGTYIVRPLEPYVARMAAASYSAELAKVLMKTEKDRASKLKKLFEEGTRAQNLVAEWRFDTSENSNVPKGIIDQARSADVLMISANLKDSSQGEVHEPIAPIITGCSRPTIVIPEDFEDVSFGHYVFIAWDGSRESSRAVFDALPILKNAKNVWLHRVKSNHEVKQHGDEATKYLASALARHDVNIETSDSTSSTRHIGEELLACARDRGADCIVMGAYGHNRVHGLLLGDATRHMLANSTIPLIMSH